MVSLWTKSILALPLVGLALVNLIVMLELLGRTERRFNPKALRWIHRIVGIVFILLFLLISYFCLRFMRVSVQDLSARVALHSVFSVAAFILLCLKLSFVRYYRKYYSMAAPLGFAVVFLTLTTAGMSAGYYFTMSGTAATRPVVTLEEGPAREGALVFNKNCADCHYADKTETKIGPGLKGLFKRDTLPVSGRPVNEANVRNQLKTPFQAMPSFAGLSEDQVKGLLAFLQTL